MQKKLRTLLALHAIWGVILALSISKYGLGASSDALAYMFSGTNWIKGNGLIEYTGNPYILWPPLYPMLIGFLHAVGLSAFVSTHVIQFITFGLIAYTSSVFLLRIFPDDFAFALLGSFLLLTGPVVISTFYMIGTDYLFMLFPIALALLIQKYSEQQTWFILTLMGLTAALAMLTRYIGYALVLSTVIAVFYYSTGSVFKRFFYASYSGVFSLSPFLWMLKTWQVTSENFREPLTFIEYASQYTLGILDWLNIFLENEREVSNFHFSMVWGPIILAVIVLFLLSRKIQVFTPMVTFSLGFGAIYTIALFSNALISYFNRLWGRFQLPIYFPLVILVLLVIQYGLKYLRENHPRFYSPLAVLGILFLLFIGTSQVNRSIIIMQNARNGIIAENHVNTQEMNENSVIQYWRKNPPEGSFKLFSNYPEIIAFFTEQQTYASPRKSGVYDKTIIPLESYTGNLFSSGQDVYLLWVEPHSYVHVYLPHELEPIAKIKIIFENEDGGLYLLHPIK
ncbi:MAG: hypothetical protein JNM46_04730 [Anaerolineales bacterium]|nr:hypothetical protein [Anaerolineales bacterium]